jgi:hypothetical protein
LEKQLRSWIPRRPSAKIARRLFEKAAPGPAVLRRAEVWNWLTPVAACALALMFIAHGADRRFARSSVPGNDAFFATLVFNASSNVQQTFALSKADENVEWNIWPHPFQRSISNLSRWSVIPTNR